MARNIEIKAQLANQNQLAQVQRLATSLSTQTLELISQDDTFFNAPQGRLKLREFEDGTGELIHYHRANQAGPKLSDYVRTPTTDPTGLRKALARAYGVLGRVIKQRTVVMVGRTRVHLDVVQNLGCFLELEVVLQNHESPNTGIEEAHALMAQLGVHTHQLIEGAYLDLLALDLRNTKEAT